MLRDFPSKIRHWLLTIGQDYVLPLVLGFSSSASAEGGDFTVFPGELG
jgi:hypothetical protein